MPKPGYTGDVPQEDADIQAALEGKESPAPEPNTTPENALEPAPRLEPVEDKPPVEGLDTGVKKAVTQYAIEGVSQDPQYLASLLPTKKSSPKMDFSGSVVMIYGPPKIGKSDLASQFPTPLFLATEEGHDHLQIYKTSITSWQHYLDTIQALITYDGQLPYRTIVVDTVDLLLDFCLTHYTQQAGVSYPSDEAFGKGWDSLRREWQKGVFALIKLGYTVIFLSHAKQRKVVLHGVERDQVGPSLGTTGRKVVIPSVDYIIALEHAPRDETKDGRKMVLQGNETIEAGDRSGAFPPEIGEISYAALEEAYKEYVVPALEAKYNPGGKK